MRLYRYVTILQFAAFFAMVYCIVQVAVCQSPSAVPVAVSQPTPVASSPIPLTPPVPPIALKDPSQIFAEAAPFYDFSADTLKPFHMKVSYQLYDDKDHPTERGTYEYWWVSRLVNRSTWIRGDSSRTEWRANGKPVAQETGSGIGYYEERLRDELLTPLPDSTQIDATKYLLDPQETKSNTGKAACVQVIPRAVLHVGRGQLPLGFFPTYCFNPDKPILIARYGLGTVSAQFNRIATLRGHYLPQEVNLVDDKQKRLTARVDSVTPLLVDDPALIPSPEAQDTVPLKVTVSSRIFEGLVIKTSIPHYPDDAKAAGQQGKCLLHITIGKDGHAQDVYVLSAPWPSLARGAILDVMQWEFKPYRLNGHPVQVETTYAIQYTLGEG